MSRLLMLASAALLLGGCSTIPDPQNATPAQSEPRQCSSYERSRLSGLKFGGKLNPPDPATAHGQRIAYEIAVLEALCDPQDIQTEPVTVE